MTFQLSGDYHSANGKLKLKDFMNQSIIEGFYEPEYLYLMSIALSSLKD